MTTYQTGNKPKTSQKADKQTEVNACLKAHYKASPFKKELENPQKE